MQVFGNSYDAMIAFGCVYTDCTVQVKPDTTPDEFWRIALETGRTIQIPHNGQNYELGIILNPKALIEALKTK